jgi:hypothetical protein
LRIRSAALLRERASSRIGQQQQPVSEIRENGHRLVHGRFRGIGHGKLENRFLVGGVGVAVMAELHAHLVQERDQLAGREMLRTVEGDVLDEVGEAVLGV